MPKRSPVPCTTSVGTVTASSSARRLGAGARPLEAEAAAGRRGTALRRRRLPPLSGTRRGRPTSGLRRRPAPRAARLRADARSPPSTPFELARRCRRTAPRNPVRLLDERDAHADRLRSARRRDEILRLHAATGAVTEHERRARVVQALHVRLRGAERRVDLERLHRDDAATPAQSGRSGTVNPCSRPSSTARVTAADPNRRRTSSSAASSALPLKRSSGSTSCRARRPRDSRPRRPRASVHGVRSPASHPQAASAR